MFICKFFGILALVYSFVAGASNWQRASKKESLAGIIFALILITSSMYGIIYLLNNW